ncbi:MAG: DUF4281 domain-containing protein [Kaiparowitsia implicata GSE-PSE-MK54-09C]|jgi:hypothetical protein|nr:DUF4281 domain-containing protein [Kaiparowitsia implicata GSE-PSE-MK54-09C]
MTLDLIFDLANVFVLPFWVLMILLPKWGVTRRVMASHLPFVALAAAYIYGFVNSIDPDTAEAFTQTDLTTITQLFSTPAVAATGWIHFLVMDLFVGRWIYLEGERTGTWTVHSLVLCLFAGPMGLLSHIVTQWVSQRGKATDATVSSADPATQAD